MALEQQFNVTNIKYEQNGNEHYPDNFEVFVPIKDLESQDADSCVLDMLSDHTGFLIQSCIIKKVDK
jgi:hypothetical protein